MRIVRRMLLAAALAVSGTLFVPATPAVAGGQQIRICFQVGEIAGRPIFDCFTIVIPELAPKPPWPDTCLSCPAAIDLRDWLDPVIRDDFFKGIGEGFRLLAEAELSTDPKQYKKLRELSSQEFFGAAGLAGGAELKLNGVGWADLKGPKFHEDSTHNPALKAAGEQIVAGIARMQLAMGDPHPEPNIEAAMAHFTQAYKELDTLHGG
jgi:hypothetical protein